MMLNSLPRPLELTVVTASIPERADLLAEASESVVNQTQSVVMHRITLDEERLGAPTTLNAAMQMVDTEWVMILDDDDLLKPIHVEVMGQLLEDSPGADVLYSRCEFVNDKWEGYEMPFSPERLTQLSIVPMTAVFRREWFDKVGGFEQAKDYDWRFWKSLLAAGAAFAITETVSWIYRFAVRPGHINDSRGDIQKSHLPLAVGV